MFRRTIFIVGCIFLTFSIFAKQLGIDNDEGWGPGRIAILLAAIALISIGLISIYFPAQFSRFTHSLWSRNYLFIAILIVTAIYVWTSQQNARHTQKDFKYYSELARSFKSGRLYLEQKPSAALLALADPYDYDLRAQQLEVEDFPWDVSLYNEKFYLYYGPTPALLLTAFSTDLLLKIGDSYLVLAFAFGLFIYGTLIIMKFFARAVPKAPGWMVGLSVLAFGLSAPTAIMLLESRLYQAAVFGAQFFFIGGCFWVYSALTGNRPHLWKLALAGVHWALALGTRVSIAPMILYAAAVTTICIFILFKLSMREMLPPVFALGIPLLAAAAGLAAYNQARFGSIFEFGLQYTLTDVNYPKAQDIFAVKHIGTNFYNYFIHPLRLRANFPYLMRIEYRISNERLGGLLFIAPYILFAFLPVLLNLRKILTQRRLSAQHVHPESWFLTTTAGSAIIGLFTILSFWTVQLRYTQDFMPSALLFAGANVGIAYNTLEEKLGSRKLLILVMVLFTFITVVASTLVALKGNSLSFWVDLFHTLLRILNLK